VGACSGVIRFIISSSKQIRTCAIQQQQANLVIVVQELEKSCRGRTGKCLALSFVELHGYYFEMFAKCEVNGLSSHMAIRLATSTSQMV